LACAKAARLSEAENKQPTIVFSDDYHCRGDLLVALGVSVAKFANKYYSPDTGKMCLIMNKNDLTVIKKGRPAGRPYENRKLCLN
jgi:hypothetical protein